MGQSLLNIILITSTILLIIAGSFYNLQKYIPIKNDKTIHFIAYFILSTLFTPYLSNLNIFIFLFILGASIEVIQPLAGRKCCVYDQLANTSGIICSITLVYLWGFFFGNN
jgi:VanZ family protein